MNLNRGNLAIFGGGCLLLLFAVRIETNRRRQSSLMMKDYEKLQLGANILDEIWTYLENGGNDPDEIDRILHEGQEFIKVIQNQPT